MGVLACDRKGCTNVMCDFVSYNYGYLCWDCRDELVQSCGAVTIGQFMDSEKHKPNPHNSYAWESYVDGEFKNRYDNDYQDDGK